MHLKSKVCLPGINASSIHDSGVWDVISGDGCDNGDPSNSAHWSTYTEGVSFQIIIGMEYIWRI